MKQHLLYIILILTILLSGCGESQIAHSGGSSVDVNGISGWIRGNAITSDSLQIKSVMAKLVNSRTLITSSYDRTTNYSNFLLPLKETGDLSVVVYDSLYNGYYSPISVHSITEQIDLESIILTPMGHIEGTINCSNLFQWHGVASVPEDFLIVIPEIGVTSLISSNGYFSISNIAQGTYTIQIVEHSLSIKNSPSIALFDTVIAINSADTLSLPEFKLQPAPYFIDDPLYFIDSAIVREILDSNGDTASVLSRAITRKNRVAQLRLSNIDSLPASIGKLDALEKLTIIGGEIDSLPTSIGDCNALQWLTVIKTELDTLPTELLYLNNFTMLDISYNKFTKIPSVVLDMAGIPMLNMDNNKIFPTDQERDWLLKYRYYNDSTLLYNFESTQRN